MTIEVKVPQLPESVNDATIAAWTKKVGDAVEAEENLVELETDKVVLEVSAVASGVLAEIKVPQGETVVAGDVLALIDETARLDNSTAESADNAVAQGKPANASPSVRKMLAEHHLDASQIKGTGKHGQVLKKDVEAYLSSVAETLSTATASSIAAAPSTAAETAMPSRPAADGNNKDIDDKARPERRVPMTRLRARIAERLLDAQRNAAILSTFNEVDLSEVVRLRKRYQERFQAVHGIKLGFMSFFVKAATEALKRYPEVNARIDDGDIIYQGYYDIGVAVSSERGLVVPILRNTDQMGNADVEKAIADFASRARSGHLELEELTGGTFSISNGGIFGSMLSTPIINPPQSAILGMHKIEQRPVAVDGEVVIRPMMYLALSYDHRLIDGKAAVSFLVKVKELLEDPASLFLEL